MLSTVRGIRISDSSLSVDGASERLVREGWLLPLRTRRSWEFVPASRAGRFGSGDPLIELRALLAHRSDAPVALAFNSAVWALVYSTHQPMTELVAHRPGDRPDVQGDWSKVEMAVRALVANGTS